MSDGKTEHAYTAIMQRSMFYFFFFRRDAKSPFGEGTFVRTLHLSWTKLRKILRSCVLLKKQMSLRRSILILIQN